MTAQFDDQFRYRDKTFAVAGISEGTLFDPALLEIEPRGTCTACYRGYVAIFALAGSRLVLDTLHVELADDTEKTAVGPAINGVSPSGADGGHGLFNNHYTGLAYHLEYSGGLLLADGFITKLYGHMGFHPPWKYEQVVELVFENGILTAEYDRSEEMAELRERIVEDQKNADPGKQLSEREAHEFIERAFDRSYRF